MSSGGGGGDYDLNLSHLWDLLTAVILVQNAFFLLSHSIYN